MWKLSDFPYSKFSPIAREGHPQLKEGSQSYIDYWEEQEYYIKNGITIGGEYISGAFYHWLNYFKIDFLDEHKLPIRIYPILSDVDREIFYMLDQCNKFGKDFMLLKVRDKGASNILASESQRYTQFIPKAKVGAVFPGGQSKAMNNFKEKFFDAINDLPIDIRVNPDVDNSGNITFGFTLVDKETKSETYVGMDSRMSFFNAVNKDVLKSDRYNFGFIDEAGEIDILQQLIDTSVANFRKGNVKMGTLVVTGTTNAMNKGHEAFRDLWFNAEEHNFERFFIPGWKKYFPFVNSLTGESLEFDAKEALDIERAKATKIGAEKLLEFKQNYGNTVEEVFTNTDNEVLNKEKMTKQIVSLMATPQYKGIIQKGNLVERQLADGTTDIRFEADNINGRWEIYLHPLHTNIYAAGTKKRDVVGVDSVAKDIAEHSSSKCAMVVYRPFINVNVEGQLPVCIYHYRHNEEGGRDMFYDDIRITLEYYKAQALVERVDDDLFTWFRKKNLLKMLKERPNSLYINKFKKVKWEDYGVPPHGEESKSGIRLLRNEINTRCENIKFVTLLNDLKNWSPGTRKNSDLGDAFKWALLFADAETRFDAETEQKLMQQSAVKPSAPRFKISGQHSMQRIDDQLERMRLEQAKKAQLI